MGTGMQKKNYLANVLGLSTLVVPTITMAILVPPDIFPPLLWFFVFTMWAVAAVFIWEKMDGGWNVDGRWRINGGWKRWFLLAA